LSLKKVTEKPEKHEDAKKHEEKIICELKAIEIVNPVWEAQIISHLKLTDKRLGYLINFNVSKIKSGIRRYVN